MPTLNLFMTVEQERFRELVGAMYSSERPLDSRDLKQLGPFVKVVREEIVETERSIRRIEYFMLNAAGRSLYRQWLQGGLDHLVKVGQA